MICCICGDKIKKDELSALRLMINNIGRNVGSSPRQELFAHDFCFANILDDSVPFDAEVLME